MSDILIKNMKMPARCELCRFSGISGKSCELISCTFTGKHRYFNDGQYMDGCPLVELQPHGRLIDADVPVKCYYYDDNVEATVCCYETLANFLGEDCPPTVIEAEGE